MSRLRSMMIALEDNDVVPEEIQPGVPAEVEAGVADMVEDSRGVDELATAIEEAGDDVSDLEKIEDVVSDSVESGEGVEPVAAEMADIAVEAIRERLGIKGRRFAPSLEAFNVKSTKLTTSKVALEGVKDTLKKAFETIRKAIAAIFERIVAFFQKHFKANKSLQGAISRARKITESLRGQNPAEPELKDERALAIDLGNIPEGLVKYHIEVTDEVVALNGKAPNIAERLVKGCEPGGETAADRGAALHNEMVTAFDSIMHKDMGCKQAKGKEKCFNIGGMWRGQSIFSTVEGKSGTDDFKIKVFRDQLHAENEVTKSLKVLSIDEQEQFLVQLLKLVDMNEKLMESEAPISKCKSSIDKALDKALKTYGDDAAADIKDLRVAVNYFMSMMAQLNLSIPVLNVSLVKSGLRYVAICQKQYKQ